MPGIDIAAPGADGPALTAALEALIPPVPGPPGSPGLQGPPGPGVPTSGGVNQILTKLSTTDYDTAWDEPQPDLSTFEYMFDVGTTEPVNSANIRFNTTSPTTTTKVWVHHISSLGRDLTNVFTLIEVGMRLFIQDKDDAAKWASFNCTGATVNKGAYDEFPVVYRGHGGVLPAQRILFNISGAGSGGVSGFTGTLTGAEMGTKTVTVVDGIITDIS